MNRVIKFRAWDGKTMRYDLTGLEHGKGNEMSGVFLDGDFYGNIPLMQFTGLHDNNGVEIYEGDVICFFDTDNQDAELLGKINYSGFVEWSDCHLYRYYVRSLISKNNIRASVAIGDLGDLENIRIIGNIYQNPELLNRSSESDLHQ